MSPSSPLQAFHGSAIRVAELLTSAPKSGSASAGFFQDQFVDPRTAEVPFNKQINPAGEPTEESLIHAALRSDLPLCLRGYKGAGKTHLFETLREYFHSKLAHDEDKGIVAFLDANELGRRIRSGTEASLVLEAFSLAVIESIMGALLNKSELARRVKRGHKSYVKAFTTHLGLVYRDLDDVKIEGELRSAVRRVLTCIKAGKTSIPSDVDSSNDAMLANALFRKCAALRAAASEATLSIHTSFDLVHWLAQQLAAIGAGRLYVCVDDLSEMTRDQRIIVEKALEDIFTLAWVQDGSVRLRLSFYPTALYGPDGWPAKYVRSESISPHDHIGLRQADPIANSDNQLSSGFFQSLLRARFTSMAASAWPKILGETEAERALLLRELYYASCGQPRRAGLVLRRAFPKALRIAEASSRATRYALRVDDIKSAATELYDASTRRDGTSDASPDEIVGLTERTGTGSQSAKTLAAAWRAISQATLPQDCGLATRLSSTFIVRDSEAFYLAPLINSGHLMRRARFEVASVAGASAVFVALSINYGYCLRENRKWDPMFPLVDSATDFEFCINSSARFGARIIADLRSSFSSMGIEIDDGSA